MTYINGWLVDDNNDFVFDDDDFLVEYKRTKEDTRLSRDLINLVLLFRPKKDNINTFKQFKILCFRDHAVKRCDWLVRWWGVGELTLKHTKEFGYTDIVQSYRHEYKRQLKYKSVKEIKDRLRGNKPLNKRWIEEDMTKWLKNMTYIKEWHEWR